MPAPLVWHLAGLLILLPVLILLRGRKTFFTLFLTGLFLFGGLYAQVRSVQPQQTISAWASGNKVSLQGWVRSAPEIKINGKRRTISFILESENVLFRSRTGKEFHEAGGRVQIFLFNPGEIPAVGDHVRLWGDWDQPAPAQNPGEFDYAKYLAERKIFSVLNGYGRPALRILKPHARYPALRWVEAWRTRVSALIDRTFKPEAAALLQALILGKRKGIDPVLREDLMKTGTAHLLAISGLHITLVAGGIYTLLIFLRIGQRRAAVITLTVIGIQIVLAGWGIPVQRAGWMAGTVFMALLLDREPHFLNTFFLAFVMLVLIEPMSLTQLSFQLSFLSVFSLVYVLPEALARWKWKESLTRSLAVLIGTFPVIAHYFNIFSPVSLLANVLAIPLFHLALLNGFLALLLHALPWVSSCLSWASGYFLALGTAWIQWLAQLRWGYWYVPQPSALQIALYYTLLAAALLLRTKNAFRWRLGSATAWGLCLLTAATFFWKGGDPPFVLTVLAAGRNEIMHLELPDRKHWLINAGRNFPSDQGRWLVVPYLRSKGINTLSGVILTDGYKRHTGGLRSLTANLATHYLLYSKKAENDFRSVERELSHKINRAPFFQKARIQQAGGEIRILGLIKKQALVQINYKDWHFLFLPALDLTALQELQRHSDALGQIDILILPAAPGGSDGDIKRLFEWMDPDFIVTYDASENLKLRSAERDIGLLDLKKQGAVSFQTGLIQARPYEAIARPNEKLLIQTHAGGIISELKPI